jgi:taurine dioxygenase
LSPKESEAMLSMLFEHAVASERVYRHQWQLHDLVVWDNFSNLHYAVANYKAHGDRYMHRVTVKVPG